MVPRSPRFRNLVFTLNNPSCSPDELYACFDAFFNAKYLIFQLERGEFGTPHYQGYAEFPRQVPMAVLAAAFPTMHMESRKGTAVEASEYCAKDDSRVEGPWTFGELSKQGKRNELVAVKESIDDGCSIMELWTDHFGSCVRYYKMLLFYRNLIKPSAKASYQLSDFNRDPLDLSLPMLLWGLTGAGKTEFADAHFGEKLLVVRHIDDLKKFDKDKHDGICFHDMDFSHWPITTVMALLDWDKNRSLHARYECVEMIAGTKMIFTYNTSNPFYKMESDLGQIAAVERRFRRVEVRAPLFGRVLPEPVRVGPVFGELPSVTQTPVFDFSL